MLTVTCRRDPADPGEFRKFLVIIPTMCPSKFHAVTSYDKINAYILKILIFW